MEPLMCCTDHALSNQITPILGGRRTSNLFDKLEPLRLLDITNEIDSGLSIVATWFT